MTFVFSNPTQVHFGSGVAAQGGREAARLTTKPVAFVVTDPGVERAGLLDGVLSALNQAGLKTSVFDEIQSNPLDSIVHAAADQFKRAEAGVLVAVGGGSCIDVAKSAALVAQYGGHITEYAGWEKVPGSIPPVIAIPTTAGTGSEVSFWAVITDSTSHAKLAIGDRHLAPAVALVDPLLTHSLPRGITMATGLDALTHAIEAYTSTLANPVTDALAGQAVCLIGLHLPAVLRNGSDAEARAGMMLAATLAGMAFNNADVAAVHCLSEAIGSYYDAPHGMINAILLPHVMAYNAPACNQRYADVAHWLGASPTAEAAIEHILAWNQEFALPTLSDVGLRKDDLPQLAAMSAANISNSSNPRPMTAADYLGLLERVLAQPSSPMSDLSIHFIVT